jgi:hypothetical protein
MEQQEQPAGEPTRGQSSRAAAALFLIGALGAPVFAQAATDDEPSVVPYRPSVSTPAALSAPGYLEVEGGGIRETGASAERTNSVPVTIKLAFTPDFGVRFGADAYVRQRDAAGATVSGSGDTNLVFKWRFALNDDQAFGVEGGATFPTARHGLGSGKSDTLLTGIYSGDFGAYHTDLNVGAVRVGAIDPGTGRVQTWYAAALSRSFLEKWGVVGEFSGTRQSGLESTSEFLIAGSYNVSKRLQFDFGLARSLRSSQPGHKFLAGFTMLGPKVF